MTAFHGKNALIWYSAGGTSQTPVNLTNYLKEYSGSVKVDTAETSTFGSNTKSYVQGLADSTLSCSGYYDGAAGAVDDIFSTAVKSTVDNGIIVSPTGTFALGTRVLAGAVIETSYQVSGSIGDAVAVSTEFQSDQGFRSGIALAGAASSSNGGLAVKTASASGGDLSGYQDLATGLSTSNGLLGILIVTANTIATKTVFTIGSAVTEPTYTAHITFPDVLVGQTGCWTGVLAPGTTINKFLRTNWTCTGAGSISFTVAAVRL